MGANEFQTRVIKASNAAEAYLIAISEARDQNGHQDGYSGDVQTCSGFTRITPLAGETPGDCVDRILQSQSSPTQKWGKAGCIEVRPGEFMFFGWGAC